MAITCSYRLFNVDFDADNYDRLPINIAHNEGMFAKVDVKLLESHCISQRRAILLLRSVKLSNLKYYYNIDLDLLIV